MGTRPENRSQTGKSNSSSRLTTSGEILLILQILLVLMFGYFFLTNRLDPMTGSKIGGHGSPSHDRLVYITTCFIGHHVEVHVKNGSIYSGIFHAASADKDFGRSHLFWFS